MKRLTGSDRELLGHVARAAVANPFGEERARADVAIAGDDHLPRAALLDRVVARATARVETLAASGLRPADLAGDDAELFATASLFVVFHRHAPAIDAHVRAQLAEGRRPLTATFAGPALADLAALGRAPEEALRNLAVFFQLRRAFYFLDRTLAGESASMGRLRARLWSNVFTRDLRRYERTMWRRMEDFSTLLLGETGSGKGAAAAALGRSGFIPFDPRAGAFRESFTETFVAVNLAQFPEGLLESEVFGHAKGAFTGAIATKAGVLARTGPHGAIFLDEIGEVPVPVQVKLLRVLQERTYAPVGGGEEARFEGRVLAATNRPLEELRHEGRFRDDFWYRLSGDVIAVPPLRVRIAEDRSELPGLVAHIVRRIAGEDVPELRARVLEVIEARLGPGYAWPGNVRELEQCVRRVVVAGDYLGDARAGRGPSDEELLRATSGGALDAQALLARYCAALHRRHGTYEEVARRTGLDRRTVRRHVQRGTGL